MADKTATRVNIIPQNGLVMVLLSTGDSPTLTGATDTLTLTLKDYGITNVLGVTEWVHTTDNSVIAPESPASTAVSSGILTVTTTTGNNNKKRTVLVIGSSNAI
jgi:hypothetical protein